MSIYVVQQGLILTELTELLVLRHVLPLVQQSSPYDVPVANGQRSEADSQQKGSKFVVPLFIQFF